VVASPHMKTKRTGFRDTFHPAGVMGKWEGERKESHLKNERRPRRPGLLIRLFEGNAKREGYAPRLSGTTCAEKA